MHRRLLTTALAFGALATGVAGCGGGDSQADTSSSSTAPVSAAPVSVVEVTTTTAAAATTAAGTSAPTSAAPVDVPKYPLTGLPIADPALAGRPALVVKVDNHPQALPQAGLNQADVVYEEIVEGITRFFVVFHSQDAAPVGPIRSGRTTDVNLLAQFNRPLFAWSGGNGGVVAAINRANAESRPDGSPGMYRDKERDKRVDREHTLFLDNTATLYTTVTPEQGTPPAMFTFRAAGQPSTGDPATSASMEMNSVEVAWLWDAGAGHWVRGEYGDPHVDTTGAAITAENVMIQFCDYKRSSADPKSPEAITVGEGDAWLLSDGKVVKGRWSRPDAAQPASFTDAQGNPMQLTPGRTWIELAQNGSTDVTIG